MGPKIEIKPRRSNWVQYVAFGILMTVATWAAVFLHISFNSTTITQAAMERMRQANALAVSSIEGWHKREIRFAENLAEDPLIVHAAEVLSTLPQTADDLNRSPHQSLLRDMFGWSIGMGEFEGYFLISRKGISLASSRAANTGTPNLLFQQAPGFLDRVWKGESLMSPLIVTDVPIQTISGETCPQRMNLFFGTPVRDARGEIVAALTMRLNPRVSLFPVLSAFTYGETAETYLVDSQGRMMSPSRFDVSGSQTSSCGKTYPTLNTPLNTAQGDDAEPTLAAQHILRRQNGQSSKPYPDYRGVDVIGVWRYSPQTGLGVISEEDAAETERAINELRWLAMSVGTVITVLLGLTGVVLRGEVRTSDARAEAGWLFEVMSRGIFFLDTRGRFVRVNEMFCAQVNRTEEELIGKPIWMLDNRLQATVQEAIRKASEDDRDVLEAFTNVELTDADGEEKVYRFSLSIAAQGADIRIGGVCADVTDVNLKRRALEQARQQAEATLRARSAFLQLASHELRTPLNAIMGGLSLIETSDNPEQAKTMLKVAQGGADDLLRTVEALEEYVALMANDVQSEVTRFALAPVLSEAISAAKKTLDAHQPIPLTFSDDTPETILSDKETIRNVIFELVANAIAHGNTEEQKVSDVVVDVGTQEQDGKRTLVISVSDKGCGMTDAEAEKAFELFTRLKGDNTAKTRGVGIGLPMAKERIERFDGTLTYRPNPSGGSIFTLTLPLQPTFAGGFV